MASVLLKFLSGQETTNGGVSNAAVPLCNARPVGQSRNQYPCCRRDGFRQRHGFRNACPAPACSPEACWLN